MQVSFPRDFIMVVDDAFSENYCTHAISYLENAIESGYAMDRKKDTGRDKTVTDDSQFFLSALPTGYMPQTISKEFNDIFWGQIYPVYNDKYDILSSMSRHNIFASKYQKTKKGEGYHVWHCEHDKSTPNRMMAWILYLNDVEEGGETEFLYQHLRVQPKQGRFVMWPAAFTHPHRGNPPLSGEKYIGTGWVEFD